MQGGDELRIDGGPQIEHTASDDEEEYAPSRVNICRVPLKHLHEHLCSRNLDSKGF
jgi:hypothetical protein